MLAVCGWRVAGRRAMLTTVYRWRRAGLTADGQRPTANSNNLGTDISKAVFFGLFVVEFGENVEKKIGIA